MAPNWLRKWASPAIRPRSAPLLLRRVASEDCVHGEAARHRRLRHPLLEGQFLEALAPGVGGRAAIWARLENLGQRPRKYLKALRRSPPAAGPRSHCGSIRDPLPWAGPVAVMFPRRRASRRAVESRAKDARRLLAAAWIDAKQRGRPEVVQPSRPTKRGRMTRAEHAQRS
jgi:hypothetical protein